MVLSYFAPEACWTAGAAGRLAYPALPSPAPVHNGPTAFVPVSTGTTGEELATDNGIYARTTVLRQLLGALQVLEEAAPESVVVFRGECSVSVAPFSYLEHRYGSDPAVL